VEFIAVTVDFLPDVWMVTQKLFVFVRMRPDGSGRVCFGIDLLACKWQVADISRRLTKNGRPDC